ncbi:hypothetical protein Pmi06nite_27740 [Planotetraspora mira]|uniref:Uncharacterized protein n=1 Tax=Planotetraspora mira TaxID=58121 RepID=A0A8J3X606_9ACTN|nr:hypothetical protein Pmi06nite_27740 [Planotetraspora mira]
MTTTNMKLNRTAGNPSAVPTKSPIDSHRFTFVPPETYALLPDNQAFVSNKRNANIGHFSPRQPVVVTTALDAPKASAYG